jgi:PIN domain nuclease of toxin-antitoxin system
VKLLLDTHTLLWAVEMPTKVGSAAMNLLSVPTNARLISAATIWELAIKVGAGKLTLSLPYRLWMETAITDLTLEIIPVTIEYAERQAMLPPHHKDPFDRLMIAQALVDGIPIVSNDAVSICMALLEFGNR